LHTVAAVYEGVNDWKSGILPSLHDSKEGWPSGSIKYRAAFAYREAGVVFRQKTKRKTTPAASALVLREIL
jgi:hypothetical protein